jgi:phage shock protein PspC (stress-responsive transcriptional regulator)
VEAISGIVTVATLLLGLLIGVRLVRRSGLRVAAPELWLGCFFLFYHALASSLSSALYTGWARPELALSDHVASRVHCAYYVTTVLGSVGFVFFTWLTFRPREAWGRLLAIGLTISMVAGAAMLGVMEQFEVRVLNGPGYWIVLAMKSIGFAWLVAESFRSWRMSRLRLRLGLADPLVSNRFLLIGVWAGITMVLSWSDPLARLWYVSLTGSTTDWVPALGRPIIAWVVAFATSFLSLSGLLLMLSFFPTERYRRWVERRAVRAVSG